MSFFVFGVAEIGTAIRNAGLLTSDQYSYRAKGLQIRKCRSMGCPFPLDLEKTEATS